MKPLSSLFTASIVLGLASSASASLVAHWMFDEGVPTSPPTGGTYTTYETVSGTNSGTFWGAATRPYDNSASIGASTQGGGHAYFDATATTANDPHIIIDSTVAGNLPSGGSARTFAAWIYVEANQPHSGNIFTYGTNAVGQRSTIRIDATGAIRYEVSGGFIYGGIDLRDNSWHHIAVVLDDFDTNMTTDVNEAKLYVDGVEVDSYTSQSFTVNTVTGGINTTIGNSSINYAANGFNGAVDDLRVYDTALSANEIAALAVPEPGSTALLGLTGLAFLLRRKR